jgi:hypothetical protein
MNQLTYLQGYPEQLLSQVRDLIAAGKLGAVLENATRARMISRLTKPSGSIRRI